MAGHDQNPTIGQLPNRDIKYTYSSYQNVEDVQCSYNYRLRVYVFDIYYTDMHDVDENENTLPSYGGNDQRGSGAGVFIRQPDNSLNITHSVVASKKNNAQPPSLLGGYVVLWCYIFIWLIHYMDFIVYL